MTQDELAERAGLSRIAVNRIETLKATPTPKTIRALALALHCHAQDLMPLPE